MRRFTAIYASRQYTPQHTPLTSWLICSDGENRWSLNFCLLNCQNCKSRSRCRVLVLHKKNQFYNFLTVGTHRKVRWESRFISLVHLNLHWMPDILLYMCNRRKRKHHHDHDGWSSLTNGSLCSRSLASIPPQNNLASPQILPELHFFPIILTNHRPQAKIKLMQWCNDQVNATTKKEEGERQRLSSCRTTHTGISRLTGVSLENK